MNAVLFSRKNFEANFSELENGVIVYYPNAFFSKGRIISDLELKERIIRIHRIYTNYVFPLVFVNLLFFSLVVSLPIFIISVLVVKYLVFKLIAKLPVHEHKLKVKEFFKNRLPKFSWVFPLSLSVLYILLALFHIQYFKNMSSISVISVIVMSSALIFSFLLWKLSK
jgi:hypothetical protein